MAVIISRSTRSSYIKSCVDWAGQSISQALKLCLNLWLHIIHSRKGAKYCGEHVCLYVSLCPSDCTFQNSVTTSTHEL